MPEHENASMAGQSAETIAETVTETESDGWDDIEGSDGLEGGFDEEPEAGHPEEEDAAGTAGGGGDAAQNPGGAEESRDGAGAKDAADAAQKEPEYPIVYNGQQMQMPVSQLTRLAQQGMNYEPVYERMTAAEALVQQQAPMVELLQQMAVMSGMPMEQYIAQGPAMMEKGFVDEQVRRGIPEDAARTMWRDKLRLAELERGGQMRAAQEAQQRRESDAAAAQRAEFEAFIREYPDVQRLPDEVIAIKQQTGESITSAYRKYELGQLKAQMAAQKAEQINRRRAPASAAGVGRKEQTDAFSDGWDNAY